MATAAIPPAFVAELIDDVGAYAGIAAIVGLAVLSLLYFTQAREVKRLREWAGRAPERDAELAARVRAEAMPMRQRTSGAPPVPGGRRPAGNGQQAARPVQPPGVPAAPVTGAGAGARAEGGQQAVGPAGQPQQPGQAPAVGPAGQPQQPGQAPGSAQQPGHPPAAQPPRAAPHPASPAARQGQPPPAGKPGQSPAEGATGHPPGQGERSDQPPTGVPAPATAAGKPRSPEAAFAQARGANTAGDAPPPQPSGDRDTKGRQAVRATAAGGHGAADSSSQRAAALRRTDASSRAMPPRGPRSGMPPPPPPVAGDGQGRGARMIGLIVAGGLAALVVGVLLITQVFGGGDDDQRAASPSNSATPAQAPPEDEGPPPRGEVNVAVLNGTTVNGLAESIADELEESGFQRGETATNTADQTLASTTVQFAEGSRDSALEVAEVLGLDEEAVEQLERNTRVTAGEEAAVIVLVGNDGVGNPAGADGGGTEGAGATDGTGGTGGATEGTGGAVTP